MNCSLCGDEFRDGKQPSLGAACNACLDEIAMEKKRDRVAEDRAIQAEYEREWRARVSVSRGIGGDW